MGRDLRPGITFYRMDSGDVDHDKIKLLFNDHGSDGHWIWCCLLDKAYREIGYYVDLNDREKFELFVTNTCRLPIDKVELIIQSCLKRKLFSQKVYEAHRILTSDRMQEYYIAGTKNRRDKGSSFEMQEQLLCIPGILDKVPLNIIIVPWNKKQNPTNNPHIIEGKDNLIKNNLGRNLKNSAPAPEKLISTKNKKNKIQNAGPPPIFVIPTMQEVRNFFIACKAKPSLGPAAWPEYLCNKSADNFWDYYQERGWKLQNQSAMVDWEASARRWNRKGYEAKANSTAAGFVKAEETTTPKFSLSHEQNDINNIYLAFCSRKDPEIFHMTLINISSEIYDYLLTKKIIGSWSKEQLILIESSALTYCKDHQITITEPNVKLIMRKYAVLEFFKTSLNNQKQTIF